MQTFWIATGMMLTIFLGFIAVVYLLVVIGLWCPRNDYNKKGGSGL